MHYPDLDARHAATAAVLDKQLFFIASCSKSGSTWLQHLLDGHGEVRCHGEAFFGTFLRPLLQAAVEKYNGSHKCIHPRNQDRRDGNLTPADVQHLYRTAVATILDRWVDGDPRIKAVGDKTPENATAAGQLLQDFPTAKIIHLIRDGRDVCVSGWFHNLREQGDRFTAQFPRMADYIPLMAAKKWAPYIAAARRAGELFPDRYLEVRYESLHETPLETTQQLLGFLGVDASEQAARACIDAGAFDRLSGGRDRGQEDKSAFFRKGQVGDWRNHFDSDCEQVFQQCAGPTLAALGYAA